MSGTTPHQEASYSSYFVPSPFLLFLCVDRFRVVTFPFGSFIYCQFYVPLTCHRQTAVKASDVLL